MIQSAVDYLFPNHNHSYITLSYWPLHVIGQIFGSVIWTYKKSSNKSVGYYIKPSKFFTIYSSITLALIILHGLLAPMYILQATLPAKYPNGIFIYERRSGNYSSIENTYVSKRETKYSLAMKILSPLLVTAMSISSRLVTLFYLRDSKLELVYKFKKIDCVLNCFEKFSERINFYKHFTFACALLLYFLSMALPLTIYCLLTVYNINNKYGYAWILGLLFVNFSSFCVDLHFIFSAYMVKVRFAYINETIADLLKTNLENKCYYPLEILHYSHYFKKWSNSRNPKKKTNGSDIYYYLSNGDSLLSDQMQLCRYSHRLLCESVFTMSSIYKYHMLTTICACFLKILFNIYFAIFGYIIGKTNASNYREESELFRTLMWNVYYIIRFTTLTGIAHLTVSEGAKTRYLISTLNNRFLDAATKEELNLFLNHISNTKLEFTACDFFVINSRLITSAIAAGTTYLVILVQFHSEN